MKFRDTTLCLAALLLLLGSPSLLALKTDRQQPLEVRADATDGTLGDGTALLKGNVEIRQGTLMIRADTAEVEKAEGRARRFELNGSPVHLQQEIENEGLVTAEARRIEYEVATGIVTLTGGADVVHPQYQISGEVLEYDMNLQHFKGSGGEESGRIRIQLDPEVVSGDLPDPEGGPPPDFGVDDTADTPAESGAADVPDNGAAPGEPG
ncbi:MAG: lipopolysaccharide transport periplasmic protein LptA [Xanthomonadales bacterium]|nr:lipopolysaccharide transport periplasmic protein LptA [Xanthomonadales bacterium]